MSSPSSIACSKCSKPATDSDARCPHCGSALARVCGECKFKNSIAKRFCDSCGNRLRPDTTLRKAPKGGRPAESRGDAQGPALPGASMGTGVDPFRASAQKAAQAKQPPKPEPIYRPSGTSEVSASRSPTKMSYKEGPSKLSSMASAVGAGIEKAKAKAHWGSLLLTVAACAAGVYGSIMIGLQLYRVLQPEQPILDAGRRYLSAVSGRDFKAAYGMLSEASKVQTTLAEFSKLKELQPWEFSELSVLSLEGSLAFLQYSFSGVWQKPQDQTLALVKEKGRWVVDTDRELLARVEDAFARRDAGEAYRLAALAAQTHRWDPLAHAYVCEAAYMRRQNSDAEPHCRQALDAASALPGRVTPATRKHLSMVLADIANDQKRHAEAVAQYTGLLSSSGLLLDEKCRLLLARADASMASSQFSQASKDIRSAESSCRTAEEREYIGRSSRILGGHATGDAVAIVKKHPVDPDGQTLQDWSRRAPGGLWSAEHLGGTKYKVMFKAENAVALRALVDLWTRNVESIQTQTQ